MTMSCTHTNTHTKHTHTHGMDLLSDIVEHETQDIHPPPFTAQLSSAASLSSSALSGFPKPVKRQPSQWKKRLANKGITSISDSLKTNDNGNTFYTTDDSTNLKKFKNSNDKQLDYSDLSEQERIHLENIEILSRMSQTEREEAKSDLLDNLDPNILNMLIKRSQKKYGAPVSANNHDTQVVQETHSNPLYEQVEGSMGTWVGGKHHLDNIHESSPPKTNNAKKSVKFNNEAKVIYLNQKDKVKHKTPSDSEGEWEDVQDIKDKDNGSNTNNIDDDLAPDFNKALDLSNKSSNDIINNPAIHFPKPKQPYEKLDLNDPHFNDKLYEKYFPDLPKNPNQLAWMNLDNSNKIPTDLQYDSIDSVRFDFNGNIITNQNIDNYLDQNQGLFNHSADPQLPGYTLPELSHYLRSTYPGQVCIASRTLGRILFKLGSLEYQITEINDENNNLNTKKSGTKSDFEIKTWNLINDLKILDLLQHYASDTQKNLSIKNYAIEALWLWKKAGGNSNID